MKDEIGHLTCKEALVRRPTRMCLDMPSYTQFLQLLGVGFLHGVVLHTRAPSGCKKSKNLQDVKSPLMLR